MAKVMHNRVHCRKMLIVKPSSLGDVVHSLPFLNAIRKCFPKAEIHWVIAKGLEGLLEGHPMIDNLIIINKDLWKNLSRAGNTLKEIRNLYKHLRHEKYDIVVDLQGLLRSGLITRATDAPLRLGFQEAREGGRFFYTNRVKGTVNIHAAERYMKMAAELGCADNEMVFPLPFHDTAGNAAEKLADIGPYAVLVPGARWKTKIWPAESFGKVAAMLPLMSVIAGAAADRAIADRVVSHSGKKARSLAGETNLKELIEIIRHAEVVISNDSGPMHIAAALNIPVIAIFGPTSPKRTGPYGSGHIVLQSTADCVPCFKRECRDNIRCMKEITPDAVYQAVLEVLRRGTR